MDSRSLTPEQARKLAEQLDRHQAYFYHLRRRLNELGFDRSDMLLVMVAKTHDLLTELKMHAHYLSCEGLVMRGGRVNRLEDRTYWR